jgi:predicted glycosyltransferase
VLSGLGSIPDQVVQQLHYKYLERFGAVWVPDAAGQNNLAGKLSHPVKLPAGTHYIGLLSRFDLKDLRKDPDAENPLVIMLSGPEPQRSNLSAILWQQAATHTGTVIFIEGSENASHPATPMPHITRYCRLTEQQLAPILMNAGMIICRSGYSTIMDLTALGKKAILIPTPGQTEQLYLAEHLHGQGIFYTATQSGFDLEFALKEAETFPFNALALQDQYTAHKSVVDNWLTKL